MKKTARFLCIMTACVMTASLVGCKGSATKKQAETTTDLKSIIPKNTVTLTTYSMLANTSGDQQGWFAKILKDKFNVKLNIVKTGDGVFATRMESGNLGDIVVFGNDISQYKQAVKGNALLDWEKDDLLKDYGSNINKNMQNALERNKSLSNGHIYGYGGNVGSNANTYSAAFMCPDIRWDLYKQLGYPQVNTLEDYVNLLADMQKLQPTSDTGKKTYGVSLFKDWDGNMPMLVKATGALYGWDEFGFGLYNVQTGEYQDALQKSGMYLRCLKFYNALYQKGLVAPDSMTQTFDDCTSDYKTGAAFFNVFQWIAEPSYNQPVHLKAGKAMEPLAAKDLKNVVSGVNIYGGNSFWTIGAKTQYPELCLAIINWLGTPEGVMTISYGPKGSTWDYDKNGDPYLTDIGKATQAKQDTEMTGNYSGKWSDGRSAINNGTRASDDVNPDAKHGETYNLATWPSQQNNEVTDIEKDWKTKVGANDLTKYLEKNKQISVSLGTTYSETAKSNELSTTWNQVKEAIVSYSWKAIYAKSDTEYNSIVDQMTTKANSYGYADCLKYTQNEAKIRKGLEDKIKK